MSRDSCFKKHIWKSCITGTNFEKSTISTLCTFSNNFSKILVHLDQRRKCFLVSKTWDRARFAGCVNGLPDQRRGQNWVCIKLKSPLVFIPHTVCSVVKCPGPFSFMWLPPTAISGFRYAHIVNRIVHCSIAIRNGRDRNCSGADVTDRVSEVFGGCRLDVNRC